MKMKLATCEVEIDFAYSKDDPPVVSPFMREALAMFGEFFIKTTVRIAIRRFSTGSWIEGPTLEGAAYCHPCDQFVKIQGRRLALMRAFDEAKEWLSREDRTMICRHYLKAFGKFDKRPKKKKKAA